MVVSHSLICNPVGQRGLVFPYLFPWRRAETEHVQITRRSYQYGCNLGIDRFHRGLVSRLYPDILHTPTKSAENAVNLVAQVARDSVASPAKVEQQFVSRIFETHGHSQCPCRDVVGGGRLGYNAESDFVPRSELFAILDALADERPIDVVVASDQRRALAQHNLLGAPDSGVSGILEEADVQALIQWQFFDEWVFIAAAGVATVLEIVGCGGEILHQGVRFSV